MSFDGVANSDYFVFTQKNHDLRLSSSTISGFGNPDTSLFIVNSGLSANDIDLYGRIVYLVFNSSGAQSGHVFIGYDEFPIFDVSDRSLERYVLNNYDEIDRPIYVTHDASVFLALDEAGIQSAFIPGFKKTGTTTDFNVRTAASGVTAILKSGFMDVRLIVSAIDVDDANESILNTGGHVYMYEDIPTPGDDVAYTQHIIKNLHNRTIEQPIDEDAAVYDAWRLPLNTGDKIKSVQKTLIDPRSTRRQVAIAAYTLAKNMSDRSPAFYSIDDIRQAITVEKIDPETIKSIVRRVAYPINNRKKTALSAIRAPSWGNHNHLVVDSLDGVQVGDGITLVVAPTASGKTKHIIKPFAASSKKIGNFLAVAPLVSLIKELSKKLNTDNYEDMKTRQQVIASDSMSVCLPSIKSIVLKPFIDRASHIAIDEISQNLRFTSSNSCSVTGASSEDVYFELKKLVTESKQVVAADASIDEQTLQFFEQARPDEQFTIIDMPPRDTGRKCFIYESMSDLIDKIYNEMSSGGRVWIAVESADRAEVLSNVFSKQYEVMMINSHNKNRKDQKRFLEDAEHESLFYDIVIASPTISSGISVEHDGLPHFTMIAGIASGNRICPADFMQMLARVRYVPDYHVCLMPNNIRDDRVSVKSILAGQRQAAALEGKAIKENEYSVFKAEVDVNNVKYRADFANGFYWIMEYFKFTIDRIHDTGLHEEHRAVMKHVSDEIKKRHIEELKLATPIDDETADRYELNATTHQQTIQLEAYKIRKALGYSMQHVLTDQDIEMRDHIRDMDRLNKYKGIIGAFDDAEKNIALRAFNRAQVLGYKLIFDGIKVEDFVFNQETSKPIMERVIENRFLLASLGLIPRKYAKWDENQRSGVLKPYPMPSDAVKAINQVIQYMGVTLRSKKKGTGKELTRIYAVDRTEWDVISNYADRRFASKNKAEI